jgi:hypothetical protein
VLFSHGDEPGGHVHDLQSELVSQMRNVMVHILAMESTEVRPTCVKASAL